MLMLMTLNVASRYIRWYVWLNGPDSVPLTSGKGILLGNLSMLVRIYLCMCVLTQLMEALYHLRFGQNTLRALLSAEIEIFR